jgi:hypothetical protein
VAEDAQSILGGENFDSGFVGFTGEKLRGPKNELSGAGAIFEIDALTGILREVLLPVKTRIAGTDGIKE